MEQYPDLDILSLFVKVVEAGSFAKVSAQHRIPKATLSRKITQLEEFYGAQLLVRNTRHLQLSEIGREILARAHSLLAMASETQTLISKTKETPQGLLRISAGVEYGLSVISPIVNEYLKHHPQVSIELDLTGRRVDLIYEGFDLGVRIGPLEDSSLSARRIGSFSYGLFCGKAFATENKITSIDKIKKLPTLGFTRHGNKKKWVLISKLEEQEIEIEPRLTSNNYWTLLNAAKANLGVVFMPHFLAQKEVKAGKLVPLLSQWTSEEIPIHFLYPSQRYLNSKVRSFIDFSVKSTSRA